MEREDTNRTISPTPPSLWKVPKRVRDILKSLRAHRPERIYLFGSWSRGEGDEMSDVDLVVIMNSEKGFIERAIHLAKSLPPSLGGIDLLAYTPEEFQQMLHEGNAFAEMIADEGKIIYEQHSMLKEMKRKS